MLQNLEVPDTKYYISYNILFTNSTQVLIYLATKLILLTCFICLTFGDSPQTIHKQKSDKKPITDTQLIS